MARVKLPTTRGRRTPAGDRVALAGQKRLQVSWEITMEEVLGGGRDGGVWWWWRRQRRWQRLGAAVCVCGLRRPNPTHGRPSLGVGGGQVCGRLGGYRGLFVDEAACGLCGCRLRSWGRFAHLI